MCRKTLRRRLSLNCSAGIHQTHLHNPGETAKSPGSGPVVLGWRGDVRLLVSPGFFLGGVFRVTSVINDDLSSFKTPGRHTTPPTNHSSHTTHSCGPTAEQS